MANDWVEVQNCAWLHEAQFLGSVLDSAGIEWLIPDQYTVGVQPFYAPALGGIRILVHADEVARARELLGSVTTSPSNTDEELPRLPPKGHVASGDLKIRARRIPPMFGRIASVFALLWLCVFVYVLLFGERDIFLLGDTGRRVLAIAIVVLTAWYWVRRPASFSSPIEPRRGGGSQE